MRFIGGKSLMLNEIDKIINENITDEIVTIGDLFSGSGIVSQHFKKQGKQVISNDIMYMSYVLVRGMTELNTAPKFTKLSHINVFDYLNNMEIPLDKDKAFIYHNYTINSTCNRMYFQPGNALKIDTVRQQIEKWFLDNRITESEYYYLLSCLISAVPYVANIAGVYAAYLKHWDKRTYNQLQINPIEIINSDKTCKSYNMDAIELCKFQRFDLAYIDTPYNKREYSANYHILETIAKYDTPTINGITGMRPYKKSAFCSKSSVKQAFKALFQNLQSKYAIVSYNNEGLLDTEEMISIFNNFGAVKLYEYPYRRYKSKIPNNKIGLKEQIYFINLEE